MFVLGLRFTSAQKDTVHYMHSFVSVNAGYGINLRPASNTKYAYPFWGENTPEFSLSGLLALKSTYFGIPFVAGYLSPKFNISQYLGFYGDSSNYPYQASGVNIYHVYYFMTGLNIKLPQRTTPFAIELRIMFGPVFLNQSDINYSYSTYPPANTISETIYRANTAALGFGPGIGLGYILSNHWALMANADMLIAEFEYHTTMSAIDNNSVSNQVIYMRSVLFYGNLTGSLVYTFGKMTPNIAY
jgi:hypothetical protein